METLVFIEVDGHWLRVDRIESIHPMTSVSLESGAKNGCWVKMISESAPRPFRQREPEYVIDLISRAANKAWEAPPQSDVPDLDLDAEPTPPGITETRGGLSWGKQ